MSKPFKESQEKQEVEGNKVVQDLEVEIEAIKKTN